jgi:hypothetical protein
MSIATAPSATTSTATSERALTFLGEGHSLEVTAAACGVSVSRISQLLADENFAAKVATLRYQALVKQSKRTDVYEELEDTLLEKLKASLCMIFDPMKLARLLQVISVAKPKNTFIPSDLPSAQQTVALTIPSLVINRFTTNTFNQVIEIHAAEKQETQTLLTIQSKTLDSLVRSRPPKENPNVYLPPPIFSDAETSSAHST